MEATEPQKRNLKHIVNKSVPSSVDGWKLIRCSNEEYLKKEYDTLCLLKDVYGFTDEKKTIELFEKYFQEGFRKSHIVLTEDGVVDPIDKAVVYYRETPTSEPRKYSVNFGSRINDAILFIYNGSTHKGVLIDVGNRLSTEEYFGEVQKKGILAAFLQCKGSRSVLNAETISLGALCKTL